ncbi:AI-2E family transporter [Duncaniella dubosii]|jgi:predicted PurR-regulated permease PerM|uniref:AI-2E family transporter n=1 Tax=Duncaniella dubosii TaxID=2518971 RepID=UPI000B2F8448|nr:AI-2E family transporter [uncultured Duncaniella sp.]
MLVRQRYDLDRTVRLVINCVLFVGAIWLISILKGVLLPFCVGCLIAYLFEPFVQFNRQLLNLKGRVIASLVTLFEMTFFLLVILYFITPMIISESSQMAALLKSYTQNEIKIPFIPESLHEFLRNNVDFEFIARKLSHEEWMKMFEEGLSASWHVITGSISLVMSMFSWVIVLLYVVFIMIDYDKISRGFQRMVMPKYRRVVFKIGRDVKHSMNQYFRGQALVAFFVGILFSIGFLIIGLPMAIILGMFIGLLNMVPYLQLISLIPATIICIVVSVGGEMSFWTLFWKMIAVYCIVQVIQDLVLTPKIIGKAMSLNPALIFLSLSVWGTLLGMIGLIIAIPLTTLLLAYYEEYFIKPYERKAHRHLIDKKQE